MLDFQSDQIDPCVREVEGHIVELPEGVEILHEYPSQQTVKRGHESVKIIIYILICHKLHSL